MDNAKRPYGHNNIFTFDHKRQGSKLESQLLPSVDKPDSYKQFDLGIIEISDNGNFDNVSQLDTICQRIRKVREENPNGAIVVVFIHGWHNNADWDNANLSSFRHLLKALMNRETEFLRRRVIGVYIGWNGEPADGMMSWLGRIPLVKHTSFKNRYSTAQGIGQGDALSYSLVNLTTACKDVRNRPCSQAPLIMIGHSMGAFILQSAFREFLRTTPSNPLFIPVRNEATPVKISNNAYSEIAMPDLLLSLNSAAEAEVATDIIAMMKRDGWKKCFSSPGTSVKPYNPPLLISTTSVDDSATNWIWRAGHFFQKPSTDGHDPKIATHSFVKTPISTDCPAFGPIDFGLPWHCIHKDLAQVPTPRFRIDLPDHDRSTDDKLTHTAYDLIPMDQDKASPFWLFQTPSEIVADHNDIFNYRAASFVLALIQVSAVLASAGSRGWTHNFSERILK